MIRNLLFQFGTLLTALLLSAAEAQVVVSPVGSVNLQNAQGNFLNPTRGPSGTCPGTPTWSFTTDTTSGLYLFAVGSPSICAGSSLAATFLASQSEVPSGAASGPGLSDLTSGNTGLFWPLTNVMGVGNTTDGEWVRWGSRLVQYSRASADTVPYAINARKARGTVALPTVITTGDSLLTQSGFGYVGAVNTYLEATRIEHVGIGTITDATTGLGGRLLFRTTNQGVDAAVVTRATIDSTGITLTVPLTAPSESLSGNLTFTAVAPLITGATSQIYEAGVQHIFRVNAGGLEFGRLGTGNNGLTLGVAGTNTGILALANGAVGGASATVQNNAATVAYNFNLPAGAGTAGQPLLSGGGGAGPMTFGTLGVAVGGTGLSQVASQQVTTAGTLIAAGATQAQTGVTITGVTTASACMASVPTALPATWQTGIAMSIVVTLNTATLQLTNPTAAGITPAAQAVNIKCIL